MGADLRSRLGTALLTLPDPVLERVFPQVIGYTTRDVPPPLDPPSTDVRLLIAPANSAGQGYAWARAADMLPRVGARNLFVLGRGGFPFAADATVGREVFQKSHRWGRRQAAAVCSGFTHVLVEAERPILGRHLGGDVRREHRALRDAGLTVGYISHGSDLRLPSRHAAREPWSPYRDRDWDDVARLERVAADNARLLGELGEPVYVATPELLDDMPQATWLPNCVDVARWRSSTPLFGGDRPRVVHAPTNTRIKGTELITPALDRLVADGVVDYERLPRVEPARMPAVYASADVVLEQFRLGIYSTTAIEAMASGRLVVGHISPGVRDAARQHAGMALPIVEATVDTLADVLRDIAEDPDRYAGVAGRGPAYVEAVHSTAAVARTLAGFVQAVP